MNERMPTAVFEKASPARGLSDSLGNETTVAVEKITPRRTLEDFAARPLTVKEFVQDYFKYLNWFSNALLEAGYPLQEVDELMKNSFDMIPLGEQTPEKNVDDVNKIIRDLYDSISGSKKDDALVAEKSDMPVVSESPISAKTVLQAIENDTHESDAAEEEYYEKNRNSAVMPEMVAAPAPVEQVSVDSELPTLVFTPEQRVDASLTKEAVLIEQVEAPTAMPEGQSNYRSKLEQLAAQPFNHDAYIELTFDIHSGLRAKYDAVVNKARAGLKRYSETYTPSKTEKEALQFLSRLQAQYAKMQNGNSELSVMRAKLMNTLEVSDMNIAEATIPTTAENYLVEVEKFLSKIEALDNLIDVAEAEEKPHITEAYRAQLGRLQFEGNQVLASVSTSHPLYEQFKYLINEDLLLVQDFAAVENGGDQAVVQEKNFFARRDRIKAAILYLKTEQDFADFNTRMQKQLDELTRKADSINPSSPDGVHTKESLVAILQELQAVLHKNNQISPQATLSSLSSEKITEHIDGLKNQKQDSKNMIGAAKVFFNELGVILETEPNIPTEARMAEVFNELDSLPAKFLASIKSRTEEVRNAVQPSESIKTRLKTVLLNIQSKKIGKIAALAAFLVSIPQATSEIDQQNFSSGLHKSPLLIAQTDVSVAPQFNFDSVLGYLRAGVTKVAQPAASSSMTAFVVPKAVVPQVDTIAPKMSMPSVPVEVVPGVVFGSSDSQVIMPERPDLKIFSTQADQVPVDDGIVFDAPAEGLPDILYKINIGDRFWDINEGETLAGKLPVMSQINPYFKQALIDRVRDRINADSDLRTKIGAMGDSADELHSDEYMNLTELNDLAERLAVEYGYLS